MVSAADSVTEVWNAPDRPWVIAHRGASYDATENTLEAFREARRQGADAVELDARRCYDGTIVVHHDAAVDGTPLVDKTRAWISANHPHIPTLDQALEGCEGMWVDIELKNSPLDPDWDPTNRVARDVAAKVSDRTDVMITSFNPAAVSAAREANPELMLGLLVESQADPQVLDVPTGVRALLPRTSLVEGIHLDRWRRRCDRDGLLLIVWTVDARQELARLRDGGVDGLITNVPKVARSVVDDDNS